MNNNIEISQEEFDTIEGYILKELSPEEYKSFAEKLSNDEELQAKVKTVSLLVLGVQEEKLVEKMNDFHASMPSSKHRMSTPVSPMRRWLAAASVIILVGIASWILLIMTNRQEKLFAEFYSPDPGLISAMSTADNYKFDRAMLDYKTGNYDSAIKAWQELLPSKPTNDTLNYFIGSAHLAKGESSKAITYLKKVFETQESYFTNDAYWYLGIALIKEGRLDEAVYFIEKSGHEKKDLLLSKLKSR